MGDVVPFAVDAATLAKMGEMFGDTSGDLRDGVSAGFGVVSFKGKSWRVKYKGDEILIKNSDGDPVASLNVVIVKGSAAISKLYYPGAYTEGDDSAPACFSMNGVIPDPSGESIQSPTCAACPKNVWGSKITEQGNKTKACADSRRIAVVPYPDIANEAFGGPMLVRIPPATLNDLARYAEKLKQIGLPYQAVVTKIGFDHELAYPKLTFEARKGLTAEEAVIIKELMEEDAIGRMLETTPVELAEPSIKDAAAKPAAPAKAKAKPKPAPETETPHDPETGEVVEDEVQTMAPAPKKQTGETPKQSPKEANAVGGEEVTAALSDLVGDLLG